MARKEKDLNAIKAKRIDSRPFSEISELKVKRHSKKKKRINRSLGGDITLFVILCMFGAFSIMPLILTVCNAFKPLDEIFLYPPRFFVRNPTLTNFSDLINALGNSLVPFSRYLFNTIMITIVGTIGHIFIASMCAYPLAKYHVPGGKPLFRLVVLSLMFPAAVKLKFSDNTPRVYEVPGGKAGMVICAVLCFLSVGLATYSLMDFDPSGFGFWMQWIGLALTFGVGVWLYYAGKKNKGEE